MRAMQRVPLAQFEPALRLRLEELWGQPPNLYKGPVLLADGRAVEGVLYPRELAEGRHRDISAYGDWRPYRAARDAER